MVAVIRVTTHIIAGHGSRRIEYRCGDLVLAGIAEATEWCLRGWACPADSTPAPPASVPLLECFPCEALAASA